MEAVAPGRQGLQQGNNPLPGRQGPQQGNNPLPGKRGPPQVSSPLQGKRGPPQVSNPHNLTARPIAIPGRDRQVPATLTEIITPGARGNKGHRDTSRAGHSTSRADRPLNHPARHRRPDQVAAVPQEVQEEGRSQRINSESKPPHYIVFSTKLNCPLVEKGLLSPDEGILKLAL